MGRHSGAAHQAGPGNGGFSTGGMCPNSPLLKSRIDQPGYELVGDKGYHSRALLKTLAGGAWKTRIAEPKQRRFSRWHGDDKARAAVCPTMRCAFSLVRAPFGPSEDQQRLMAGARRGSDCRCKVFRRIQGRVPKRLTKISPTTDRTLARRRNLRAVILLNQAVSC
jgi:hypothetical protein